jgi:hypothetical protein
MAEHCGLSRRHFVLGASATVAVSAVSVARAGPQPRARIGSNTAAEC